MQAPKRKIGLHYLYDPKTGIQQDLPIGFQIYHYTDKVWVGGSNDGKYYLQIERIRGKHIPTILAEGDLGLFLTSVRPPNKITANLSGVQVAGTLRSQDLVGYLAKVDLPDKHQYSYLILIASEKGSPITPSLDYAIRLANDIETQHQSVPA